MQAGACRHCAGLALCRAHEKIGRQRQINDDQEVINGRHSPMSSVFLQSRLSGAIIIEWDGLVHPQGTAQFA